MVDRLRETDIPTRHTKTDIPKVGYVRLWYASRKEETDMHWETNIGDWHRTNGHMPIPKVSAPVQSVLTGKNLMIVGEHVATFQTRSSYR